MGEEAALSPPLQLLQLVWRHSLKVTGHSWDRLNRSMQRGLDLAIDSGMQFGLDDFTEMAKRFRSEYWIGDGERYYALAVGRGNLSAARSFERKRGRKPFIWRGQSDHFEPSHRNVTRHGSRLAVGTTFGSRFTRLTVTSFNDTDGVLVACSYKPVPPGKYGPHKVARRYRLTHKDLRALALGKWELDDEAAND